MPLNETVATATIWCVWNGHYIDPLIPIGVTYDRSKLKYPNYNWLKRHIPHREKVFQRDSHFAITELSRIISLFDSSRVITTQGAVLSYK